jgi:hypothetical protein
VLTGSQPHRRLFGAVIPRTRPPPTEQTGFAYGASFAYIAGATADHEHPLPLFRLRYIGSPDDWGFAAYLASNDGYEDSILPKGSFTGTPAEALDCAWWALPQRPLGMVGG